MCGITRHFFLLLERKREWESAGLECDSRVQSVLIATLANHHDILEKTGVSLGRWGPPLLLSLLYAFSVVPSASWPPVRSLDRVPREYDCTEGGERRCLRVKIDGGSFSQFCLPIRCTGWWLWQDVHKCGPVWNIIFSKGWWFRERALRMNLEFDFNESIDPYLFSLLNSFKVF